MDGNPPDEPDAATEEPKQKSWPPTVLQQEKKSMFWMGGVMNCFSTVLSLFSKTELAPKKEDDWEVPHTDLTDHMYLGSGAQGVVFRGMMRGEMVAIKQLRDKSETNIKHLRKLDHKNIVRFRGVSVDGPIPCIIMEFCQYGPLFEFIHSGAYISAQQTFGFAKDIAWGMAYLHSKKIIHRDLKSPNILIADNLVVKVSDFGTAREWDDSSAVMSFTGTVAWMAPEIIRHEPCSERVDVWSYGVVLWELLTKEIPYRNMESHAIMWGVGTNTISLPIPASCPGTMRSLLEHCWSRTPRNRPPFKIIAANLEVAEELFAQSQGDCFSATQTTWRKEIKEEMKFVARSSPQTEAIPQDAAFKRQQELELAREFRVIYERQLRKANELYMEVCAVRLLLEQREQAVSEREKAVESECHCGVKKTLKHLQRQPSTSSDSPRTAKKERRRKKKQEPTQLVVKLMDKGDRAVSLAVTPEELKEVLRDVSIINDCAQNNNLAIKNSPTKMKNTTIRLKDVVFERNGNIVKIGKKGLDNYIPDIAHV